MLRERAVSLSLIVVGTSAHGRLSLLTIVACGSFFFDAFMLQMKRGKNAFSSNEMYKI